jgi:hypothetical protein
MGDRIILKFHRYGNDIYKTAYGGHADFISSVFRKLNGINDDKS